MTRAGGLAANSAVVMMTGVMTAMTADGMDGSRAGCRRGAIVVAWSDYPRVDPVVAALGTDWTP